MALIFHVALKTVCESHDPNIHYGIIIVFADRNYSYLQRLENRTICKRRYYYKGTTFSSVILKPSLLVWPGFEPTTSHMVVQCSMNWSVSKTQTSDPKNSDPLVQLNLAWMASKTLWLNLVYT